MSPADAIPVIRAAVGPDAAQFQMWWRALDLGNRHFRYDSDTMKSTVGLRGELPFIKDGWDYDAWFTYGRSTLDEVTRNQVNVAKLQTALNPDAYRRDIAAPRTPRAIRHWIFSAGAPSPRKKSITCCSMTMKQRDMKCGTWPRRSQVSYGIYPAVPLMLRPGWSGAMSRAVCNNLQPFGQDTVKARYFTPKLTL